MEVLRIHGKKKQVQKNNADNRNEEHMRYYSTPLEVGVSPTQPVRPDKHYN
jgi:hypothetical protein